MGGAQAGAQRRRGHERVDRAAAARATAAPLGQLFASALVCAIGGSRASFRELIHGVRCTHARVRHGHSTPRTSRERRQEQRQRLSAHGTEPDTVHAAVYHAARAVGSQTINAL